MPKGEPPPSISPLPERETENVDAIWDEEIHSRLQAFDKGEVTAIPFDDIRKAMTDRFAR